MPIDGFTWTSHSGSGGNACARAAPEGRTNASADAKAVAALAKERHFLANAVAGRLLRAEGGFNNTIPPFVCDPAL
jgi:hypothetical protein